MRVRIQGHVAGRSWWDLPIPRQFPRGPSGTCKALLVPRCAARSSSRVCIETMSMCIQGPVSTARRNWKEDGRRIVRGQLRLPPTLFLRLACCDTPLDSSVY